MWWRSGWRSAGSDARRPRRVAAASGLCRRMPPPRFGAFLVGRTVVFDLDSEISLSAFQGSFRDSVLSGGFVAFGRKDRFIIAEQCLQKVLGIVAGARRFGFGCGLQC